MKLKLDENLSRHLKSVLTALQHDVLTAADENLLSRPDTEIARAAAMEERMLLALDVEFADLRSFSVHAYWNLRPSVIWDTIQNDLPPLVEPLGKLLPKLNE